MAGNATSASGRGGNLKSRLRDELRKYLLVSGYLYVCFGALELFKTAVLRDAGVDYVPLGIAAAKALILGKFVLLGEAARVGSRPAARTLAQRIAYRIVLLLALLVVLIVVEELLVGRLHGRPLAETLAEYEHRLPEVLATMLLLLLILVPLVTVTEVNHALGAGGLARLLFTKAHASRLPDASPRESSSARGPK